MSKKSKKIVEHLDFFSDTESLGDGKPGKRSRKSLDFSPISPAVDPNLSLDTEIREINKCEEHVERCGICKTRDPMTWCAPMPKSKKFKPWAKHRQAPVDNAQIIDLTEPGTIVDVEASPDFNVVLVLPPALRILCSKPELKVWNGSQNCTLIPTICGRWTKDIDTVYSIPQNDLQNSGCLSVKLTLK